MHRRQGFTAVIAALILVVAAASCGSDDDGAGSGTETETTDSGGDAAPASTDGSGSDEAGSGDSDDSGSDDAGSGGGDDSADDQVDSAATVDGAVVSVNGEEFVLDQELVCVSLGGAVGGSFASSVDDVSFDVSLPPEDWETRPADEEWSAPSVRLDDDRGDVPVSWRAGGEVVEGMTGIPPEVEVTSFAVGEAGGSGTATVVEIQRIGVDGPVVAEMTFEFGCG